MTGKEEIRASVPKRDYCMCSTAHWMNPPSPHEALWTFKDELPKHCTPLRGTVLNTQASFSHHFAPAAGWLVRVGGFSLTMCEDGGYISQVISGYQGEVVQSETTRITASFSFQLLLTTGGAGRGVCVCGGGLFSYSACANTTLPGTAC